jgi:hypothetical protein
MIEYNTIGERIKYDSSERNALIFNNVSEIILSPLESPSIFLISKILQDPAFSTGGRTLFKCK